MNYLLLLSLILSFFFSFQYAHSDSSASIHSAYKKNNMPLAQEMNFDKLQKLIVEKDVDSVEAVIDLLPKEMLNDNYILMYKSRSLQEASFTQPRVISYSPSTQFILTFNGGSPKMAGHNSIEIIQYREKEQKFEFREIQFVDNQAKISEANPQKCLQCHQSNNRKNIDMRPNWEPYNIWPGAFGSDNGTIYPHFSAETKLKERNVFDQSLKDDHGQEEKNYAHFEKSIKPNHDRYSKLGSFNVHATTEFTEVIQILNLFRVMRLIKESRANDYDKFKEYIAVVLRCGESQLDNHPYTSWLKSQKTHRTYKNFNSSSFSQKITHLFEPLGIDTSDWSMDFGTQARFAFYERFGTPSNTENIVSNVWNASLGQDPSLKDKSCTDLEKVALEKLDNLNIGDLRKSQILFKAQTGEQVFNNCMKCHEPNNYVGAPKLDLKDFNTEQKIKHKTSYAATFKEQMPPDKRLSPEEREALLKYIQEFNKLQNQLENFK
jgi:cytochrome c2